MKTGSQSSWLVRFVALVMLLFVLYAIDFLNFSLAHNVRQVPFALLLVAFLDTSVITAAVWRSRHLGWRLAGALFLVFFGLKTFLVAIEGIYLSNMLSPALVRTLLVNGLIVAALYTPVTVWAFGRWSAGKTKPEYGEQYGTRSVVVWILRLLGAGIIYLLLFIAGGLLVFTPVASLLDPAGAAAYTAEFEAPAWLPLFVIGRGMLWALLAWPLIRSLSDGFWSQALIVGLLFAVLMADNMLLASDETLSGAIRLGHFVELFVENFLFGLVTVWLLKRPLREKVLAPSFGTD